MTQQTRPSRKRSARIFGSALLVFAFAGPAIGPAPTIAAGSPFDPLIGTWRGKGIINLKNGVPERLNCSTYYTGGGSQLGLKIRCKNENRKIEISSQLSHSRGRLRGNWEEKTYNAQGNVTGQITDNAITLAITGLGELRGNMSVLYSRRRQDVKIVVEGIGLKSVDISLTRRR